jgi:hypothetical protein
VRAPADDSAARLGFLSWTDGALERRIPEGDPTMYPEDKSVPRILQQQQPSRETDPAQQRQGSTDFQSGKPAGREQQMGEGSYEATRDYQKDIKEYLDRADVAADADKAKPKSEAEARELEDAEREGRSHSKGER